MFSKYLKDLKSVLLFKSMDEKGIENVLKCLDAKIVSYKKGEYIYSQGEEFSNIGILIEGEAEVTKSHIDGNYSIINTLKKQDTFGEDIICSRTKYANFSIISTVDSKIIYIDGKNLISDESTECKYRSQVNLNMLRRIAEYSMYVNKKLEYSTIISLKKRVAKFLLDNYKNSCDSAFSIDMNREQMASYLNGTRPAVSKILIKYKKDNIIDYHKNNFIIYDKEKLIKELN